LPAENLGYGKGVFFWMMLVACVSLMIKNGGAEPRPNPKNKVLAIKTKNRI
jgi:hypothetical protein